MKKSLLMLTLSAVVALSLNAQSIFNETIQVPSGYEPETVVLPPSPLRMQVLFIGSVDLVATTPTYGNPGGYTFAKEWHDFIGFTPDNTGESLGWVSVNHEMIQANDMVGDGGGMTAFRVNRDPATGDLVVMEQTLTDGRTGQFFNVDFVNTVGETGMNCGGINGPDGRIWTAEEWFQSSNPGIYGGAGGIRDTSNKVIPAALSGWGADVEVKAYENLNYMVEIDPREAKAIRKQYNWGRQGFEGGAFLPDNKTVILGWDGNPCFLTKFVADVENDFTQGTLYMFKQDNAAGEQWIPIENNAENMLNLYGVGIDLGATMLNRIEWVTYDEQTGRIYMTETGRDNIGDTWDDEYAAGATLAEHHNARATAMGLTNAADPAYPDYYGRVLYFDPSTDELGVQIEGGPDFPALGPDEANYPAIHLSNPDGLSKMTIQGKSYLVICEDLNGGDYGRVPAGVSNRTCEMFLLDLEIENPQPSDLIRISVVPRGAEVTGAVPTSDGMSLLVNSQHPSSDNPFPYNHSLTYAIHGFDMLTEIETVFDQADDKLQAYPNPATRYVQFNKTIDAALYNTHGQRLKVFRNVNEINVSALNPGMYFIQTQEGEIKKLIVE